MKTVNCSDVVKKEWDVDLTSNNNQHKEGRVKKLSDSKLQTILLDLNNRLKEQFSTYTSLHLFGSYAKGTAIEESDIDVLLKFKELPFGERFEVAGIVCDIEYKYDCFIDYKIMQECKKEVYNPFILEQAFASGVSYGK